MIHIIGEFTVFLKKKLFDFSGVAICMIGIACIIYADAITGGTGGGDNPLLGDILCLSSTFLYAISNISEEFLVKEHDRIEYLGFIGIFGSLISGLQL